MIDSPKTPDSPDARGYFGRFGGVFVPEVLVEALARLEAATREAFADPAFWAEYEALLRDFVGRPSPIYIAERLVDGPAATIVLKREDTNHTGAHKINNTVGQALLARRMGKSRLIAETGAGQHGVATATIGAKLGMTVDVYMGAVDVERQALNVYVMKLLGASVHAVESGTRTLKDATNEAFREWAARVEDTFYIIGSVVGAHPYPYLVREFQKVIGVESRAQVLERFGRLPTDVVACVGGGSNAMGMFAGFVGDPEVNLWGVEASGHGVHAIDTAASLSAGSVGILHGSRSYVLQDDEGQVRDTHSVSAGLDYPGVGPEHAYLKDSGRARYVAVDDAAALESFHHTARREGIVPALESAHAIAYARELAVERGPGGLVLVNLSGRGDKDVRTVAALEGDQT
ncbi:MAG: tryptophan synthase beta chain [Candidatus Eremiobacteraeota bacterium]|jgi:tryptophan synthase beta chain|nr:tryptophan synthase beta chain [Candidatus Eremiobacteraeota bacterium]